MSDGRGRPKWVDFHCHLDLYDDFERAVRECDAAQVATLAVTTTPKAWYRNKELADQSTHVRAALGLHPQLIAERSSEIALFEHLIPEARYIGEIGLDAGPRYYRSFPDQERLFERILRRCTEAGDKILTVHSVRSVSKVLGHLEKSLDPAKCRVVMHWFTGTASEARRAANFGCYFSVNHVMLKSPRAKALLPSLPFERLLTETDGPFTEVDGRPSRPGDVAGTVLQLASLYQETPERCQRQILANLRRLVSADPAADHAT